MYGNKTLSQCIRDRLREPSGDETGKTTAEALSVRIINFLLSTKIKISEFTALLNFIADRTEGKAVSMELHGEIVDSPLKRMDTKELFDHLKKLKEMQLADTGVKQLGADSGEGSSISRTEGSA